MPAIGSTRLGSLFLTLPTRALTGQQIISSEGDAFKIVERTGERWFAAELNRHKGQFLHRASCCPKTERAHRPVPSIRRHKTGDKQIDRARVLEVRIQSPPAKSQRTIGSATVDLPGYGRNRR
jgi:hypothetical protein